MRWWWWSGTHWNKKKWHYKSSDLLKAVTRNEDKRRPVVKMKTGEDRGSIHMKFSITGQKKMTCKCRWLLNRGDYVENKTISSLVQKQPTDCGLGLWCWTPLATIFHLYRGSQFYWWWRPVASNWLTLPHNVVSSTPHNEWNLNSQC